MRRPLAAMAALLLLAGCSVPAAELRPVVPVAMRPAAAAKPRLWYVGLGMQGETWSENDVVAAADRLGRVATGFEVVPVVFSNRLADEPERFPPVDGASVEAALADIAVRAVPGDVVLVYASTHGAPFLLGRGAGGEELRPVGVAELQHWLAPLRGHDTVLILSACFSGSFIPALRGEHRIVFAAARADRTSFGCQAGAEHTVFGEALLRSLSPESSLHMVVDRTREAVDREEQARGFRPPSLPQISVGAAARRFYDAPVF